MRVSDLVVRHGPRELAFLLPQTDPLGALDFAERIRIAVARLELGGGDPSAAVGRTIGIAGRHAQQGSAQHWLEECESAVFMARSFGRYCVRVAPTLLPLWQRKAYRR